MNEGKINELIKLLDNDRNLINKLNLEELNKINECLLNNIMEKVLFVIDRESSDINE